jgi:hypothetical protein
MIAQPTLGVRRRRALGALGIAIALVTVWPIALGSAAPADETIVYTLLPPGTNPEGVAFQKRSGGRFFVSGIGDGTIYRGNLDRPVARPFLPAGQDGRTEAVGLEVRRGRLYIAGGSTGAIFVYDISDRELLARFETGAGGFINDVAVSRTGHVYATDSFRPFLYRMSPGAVSAGGGTIRRIRLSPEIEYLEGFNVNGIVAYGRSVIVVHSITGELFRITPRAKGSRRIAEIPVAGGVLTFGDGLERSDQRLWVVRNGPELVVEVALQGFARRGRIVDVTGDPSFMTPTTAALARDRLLVVNSEFFETDGPPFTVSSISV